MAAIQSRRSFLIAAGLAVPAAVIAGRAFAGEADEKAVDYGVEFVRFQDLAPPYITLSQSWNALGLDDSGRVYIAWTSIRDDDRQDTALFRYTPSSGRREFLGTFMDVAAAQGNLSDGEEIPKGHTAIVQVGRKMYLGSMGFHDFTGSIDSLPGYRGAHLFAYDVDSGAFDDVTRSMPGGIAIEHQGIVALSYSPEHNLLVGLAHPLSDLVLIDPDSGSVEKVVKGIPWELNHQVSREVVVTRTGKAYICRGSSDLRVHQTEDEVWEYDIAAGTMRQTGQILTGGFWNGQAPTPDRETVFVSTTSGQLYSLDVASGEFSDLGPFIDPADAADPRKFVPTFLYGIAMSGGTIVGAPLLRDKDSGINGPYETRLTTYDIAAKRFVKHQNLNPPVFTGSNQVGRDGRIYMAAFNWSTDCRLAIFTPV